MTSADQYRAPWLPGASYHVYNRAVPLNRMFVHERDWEVFLAKLHRLLPVFELYAYALVGSHFHLHVRMRMLDEIMVRLAALSRPSKLQRDFILGRVGFQKLVGDALSRAFHGYTNYFNLKHERTGELFNETVRRLRVRDDLLSRRLCGYLHAQFIKHGLDDKIMGHGISTSFDALLGDEPSTLLNRSAVLERFGGRDAFIAFHRDYAARRRAALRRFDERRFFGYLPARERAARNGKRPAYLLDLDEVYVLR